MRALQCSKTESNKTAVSTDFPTPTPTADKHRHSQSPHPPNLLWPTSRHRRARSYSVSSDWRPRGRGLLGAVSGYAQNANEEVRFFAVVRVLGISAGGRYQRKHSTSNITSSNNVVHFHRISLPQHTPPPKSRKSQSPHPPNPVAEGAYCVRGRTCKENSEFSLVTYDSSLLIFGKVCLHVRTLFSLPPLRPPIDP